ncbi:hypothetical protein DFH09DRAFT_1345630 [Mycena vulgaris]|nr:hypothetical protein DFH09DRAFT_1345630 [Mycena vulgaris]
MASNSRRGTKPHDLGPDCEIDEINGKRGSWNNHQGSVGHLKSVQSCADSDKYTLEMHQQYYNLYASHPVNLRDPPLAPMPTAPHFPAVFPDEDSNGISLEDFDIWMLADNQCDAEPRLSNEELMRREIELMHRSYLEDEFEGADDETLPMFLEELDDLDDSEPDEDISQIFGAIPRAHEYAPYGNKTVTVILGIWD